MKFLLVFGPTFPYVNKDGYTDYGLIKSRVIEGYYNLTTPTSLEDIIKKHHPNATKCYIHEILFHEDNTKKKLRYTVDIE